MKARWRRWMAVLFIACLASFSLGAAAADVGDTVSLPSMKLLDGRTLPAGYFKGKTVLIEYWASWCPFCAMQNPHLQKLYDATRGKALEIVTVSIDQHPQDAAAYLKQHQYTFPAAMDNPVLQQAMGKRRGLPELYIIGRDGKVLRKEVGEMFSEDVAALASYAGK